MAKKKKSSFALAAEKAANTPQSAAPAPDLYDRKIRAAADADEVFRTKTRLVDPNDCIPWKDHDRLIENPTYENDYKEMVDDLIAQNEGHNHFPAEVRPIKDPAPGAPKYEITSGLRRWLAIKWLRENNYPHFKYLIKLLPMTDEEAFRYSDLENLQNKDIAPYSRAIKYKKAVKAYYNNSQTELAKRLNRSKSGLSEIIRLADLDQEIVHAYANLHDLKVHHAPPLLKLMAEEGTKANLLDVARSLAKLHAEKEARGEKPMTGSAVLKALLDSAKKPKKKKGGPIASYGDFGSGPLLSVDSKNQRALKLTLKIGGDAKKADVITAFKQALADHYE